VITVLGDEGAARPLNWTRSGTVEEIPVFLKPLERQDPEFAQRVADLVDFAQAEGALDAKTKALMSLLGDAILGHFEGVAAIAARARQQGVTEQEIAETVRMAFAIGGLPALMTGLRAFR
jgi:alkylhydroperoxidase/carboxymuconolactone decarboxylase family protein YurZ